MATPRLPFLYPNLFRAVKSCEPTTFRSIRTPPPQRRSRKAGIHTSLRRAQDTFQQRYGPATEPRFPPPSKPAEPLFQVKQPDSRKEASTPESEQKIDPPKDQGSGTKPAESGIFERKDLAGPATSTTQQPNSETVHAPAMQMVLQIPTPSESKTKTERHPHLHASPYEHHFDTYSLVQDLGMHGFTEEQAVTLMKAIRLMLAVNLDIAKEGLVSKSDVENETYLFRAACSELHTTLQTSRQAEVQRQRTQRAHLQHEADILSQKMTQDLMTLKEDMKAMFHNRKMAVQEEKSNMDAKISELNYEITVLLNSDAKTEVESLRWVLTRRAAMAVAIAAFMVMASLNYSGHVLRQQAEIDRKKEVAKEAAKKRAEASRAAREQGTQTDPSLASYEESLG